MATAAADPALFLLWDSDDGDGELANPLCDGSALCPIRPARVHGFFVEWSSALQFAEEAVDEVHRPLLCRRTARIRITPARSCAPCITLQRLIHARDHKASIDDAVLARLCPD